MMADYNPTVTFEYSNYSTGSSITGLNTMSITTSAAIDQAHTREITPALIEDLKIKFKLSNDAIKAISKKKFLYTSLRHVPIRRNWVGSTFIVLNDNEQTLKFYTWDDSRAIMPHADGFPASYKIETPANGLKTVKQTWLKNGIIHRVGGPAVTIKKKWRTEKKYFIDGQSLSKAEYSNLGYLEEDIKQEVLINKSNFSNTLDCI